MDSLPWTLYIVLAIVVWQLAGSSNYATATVIADAVASLSTRNDERFVAFRFEVSAPDSLAAPDGAEGTVAEVHPFLDITAALAT